MTSTTSPPTAPVTTVSFSSFDAYSFAFSRFPSPITFPSRIPPALATPKHSTVPMFLTTTTSEFAATASLPRWPRITEYIENATPQERSFPSAGSDSFTKSENSSLLRINMYRRSSLISLLVIDTITQPINSMTRDIAVAIATPVAPSFGNPKRPKMKHALNNTFSANAIIFIAMLIVTRPRLRSTARYTSVMPQHR